MSDFRFFPELIVYRSEAIEQLSASGFDWLSHYGSVDPLHDLYGLEACGIEQQETAQAILQVMKRQFPQWRWSRVVLKDWGMKPGWETRLHRDEETLDRNDFQVAKSSP